MLSVGVSLRARRPRSAAILAAAAAQRVPRSRPRRRDRGTLPLCPGPDARSRTSAPAERVPAPAGDLPGARRLRPARDGRRHGAHGRSGARCSARAAPASSRRCLPRSSARRSSSPRNWATSSRPNDPGAGCRPAAASRRRRPRPRQHRLAADPGLSRRAGGAVRARARRHRRIRHRRPRHGAALRCGHPGSDDIAAAAAQRGRRARALSHRPAPQRRWSRSGS